ncbi:hypothetical protein NMY22_g15759 [Coprinellus aureogranulatus]|nr:hypothetical protein NMY22_g15759 [Coprinellus aureogranulatus]
MPRRPAATLINEVELQPRDKAYKTKDESHSSSQDKPRKPWYYRLPLLATVLLILLPQPSVIRVLVYHHWRVLQQSGWFTIHAILIPSLTLLTLTSLTVCVARDPGPVNIHRNEPTGNDENLGLAEALMGGADDEYLMTPGKWCRKCWAPKPERAHHCSVCGRCVLKMDHHCPWLGSACIGHRTYPAFIHFLTCATILAIYIATVAARAIIYSFNNPFGVDETTPIHELTLALYGCIITMVIGPFTVYHYYLVTCASNAVQLTYGATYTVSRTNQTTVEQISPFMLLRHLPPLPRGGHSLSDPPLEPELNYTQRRLVREAHSKLSLYDIGWRRNWAQVFGWETRWGWVVRLLCGGASPGDGLRYPLNPRAEEMLAKLAEELVKADRENN